jgi:uncharacterized protein
MLQARIHGIKDGKFEINLSCITNEIKNLPEEFFGQINVEAILTKVGKRYTLTGKVRCNAHLVCDISLEEYDEEILANFEFVFIANTEMYLMREEKDIYETESNEIIIHEDDQYLDISELIRQELLLNIPLKKVAPKYRDLSFEELYPQFSSDKNKEKDVEDVWSELKKLKLRN